MKKAQKKWKTYLNEAGYSRTRQSMAGLAPNVYTISFLTAENPDGQKASPAYNKERNAELEKTLKNMNVGFRKVRGKFNSEERSFMVMIISKSEAVRLGDKYGQEAVIWGLKTEEEGGVYFTFEYIERGKTINTRYVSVGGSEAAKRDDMYSSVKGKKFFIPFFDDEYEGVKSPVQLRQRDLKEGALEYFEEYEERLKLTLEDGRTDRSKWHHRGVMKELEKLINK